MGEPGPTAKESCLDSLGDDLLCSIMVGLCLEDLCRLSRVSRRFHSLVNSRCADAAWHRLYDVTFGSTAGGVVPQEARYFHSQHSTNGTNTAERLGRNKRPRFDPDSVPADASPGSGPTLSGLQGVPATRLAAAPGLLDVQSQLPSPAAAANAAKQRLPDLPPLLGLDEHQEERTVRQHVEPPAQQRSWKERFRDRYIEQHKLLRLKRRARTMKLESSVQLLSQEMHRLQEALREEQGRLQQARQRVAAVQRERQTQSLKDISQQYWLPEAVQRSQGMVTSQTAVDLEGREAAARQALAVCELEVRKLRNQARQRAARLDEERRRLAALQP